MSILNVAGVDFPSPTELKVGVMDLSKAERNAKGTIIIERIATKQKLDISWKYLSAADLSTVLTAVSTVFFTVIYTDPVSNASRTATMYVGDRNMGYMDVKGGVIRYNDVKMDFIEK